MISGPRHRASRSCCATAGRAQADRTFTRNLDQDGRAKRIFEGADCPADSMGMRVVVEGIDDEIQVREVHELGGDRGSLTRCELSEPDLRGWLGARQAKGAK